MVHYGYNVFRESAVPYYDALSSVPGITQDMVFQEYWKLNKYVQAWKRLMKEPNNTRLSDEIPSYAPLLLAEMQEEGDMTKQRIKELLISEFKDTVDFTTLTKVRPQLEPYIPEALFIDKTAQAEKGMQEKVRSLVGVLLKRK